jgi:ASC-1-like (ASCH) protein
MITIYIKKHNTFQSIINRTKTIELRLDTPFFKQLRPQHCFIFQYKDIRRAVQITHINTFSSINKLRQHPDILYKIFPYHTNPNDININQYYSTQRQKKYPLLAIHFVLLNQIPY